MQIATLQDRSRIRLYWAVVHKTNARYEWLFRIHGRRFFALQQSLAAPINTAVNHGTDELLSRIVTEVACR